MVVASLLICAWRLRNLLQKKKKKKEEEETNQYSAGTAAFEDAWHQTTQPQKRMDDECRTVFRIFVRGKGPIFVKGGGALKNATKNCVYVFLLLLRNSGKHFVVGEVQTG